MNEPSPRCLHHHGRDGRCEQCGARLDADGVEVMGPAVFIPPESDVKVKKTRGLNLKIRKNTAGHGNNQRPNDAFDHAPAKLDKLKLGYIMGSGRTKHPCQTSINFARSTPPSRQVLGFCAAARNAADGLSLPWTPGSAAFVVAISPTPRITRRRITRVRFGRIPSRRPTLLTISLFDWPLRSGRTKRP